MGNSETAIKVADLGLKCIEILVIGGIGLCLSSQAEKISQSLETGNLISSTIENLSKNDEIEKIRQDLALMTLDKTLKTEDFPKQAKEDKDLVYPITIIVGNDLRSKLQVNPKLGEQEQRNQAYKYLLQVHKILVNRLSKNLTTEDIKALLNTATQQQKKMIF